MNAIRNSYFFSRVAVWFRAGSNPSITIASSTFQVDELSYRTGPASRDLVSRHVSRVDDLETIPVDRSAAKRIRCAMSHLSDSIRNDAERYIERDETSSRWLFQPKQDGWLATFDGKPRDVRAFHRWLSEIVA